MLNNKYWKVILPILLLSTPSTAQMANQLSKEFLEGLPPSVREEIEVKNQVDEESEIEKLFQSDTSMEKNKVLAWATFIMIIMGCLLICLGAFKYDDVAGWGFASVGLGFFAVAWVFNALKGRV